MRALHSQLVLRLLAKFWPLLIVAPPAEGTWRVKFYDDNDILYYWEAKLTYTYDEAKEVCQQRKMPSRVYLGQIVAGITDHSDYWAPHEYQTPNVVHVSTDSRNILFDYGDLMVKKGVVCTATLGGVMVIFRNGLPHYTTRNGTPLPTYCYPQNANRNEHDVAACILIIQKYEL